MVSFFAAALNLSAEWRFSHKKSGCCGIREETDIAKETEYPVRPAAGLSVEDTWSVIISGVLFRINNDNYYQLYCI